MSDPTRLLQMAIDNTVGALIKIGTRDLTKADRTTLETLVHRLKEVRRTLPNMCEPEGRNLVRDVTLETIEFRHRLKTSA